jgi:hypothetical protein
MFADQPIETHQESREALHLFRVVALHQVTEDR